MNDLGPDSLDGLHSRAPACVSYLGDEHQRCSEQAILLTQRRGVSRSIVIATKSSKDAKIHAKFAKFAIFGYVTEGQDFLGVMHVGDKIDYIKVVDGAENLKNAS